MKIASLTVKYGRKYQIADGDWVSLEASLYATVDEDEANDLDPISAYAELFGDVRASVRTQAFDLVMRQRALAQAAATRLVTGATLPALAAAEEQPLSVEERAEEATDQEASEPKPPAAQVAAPVASTAGPPQTPEDAEQRFFARYGEQIGGTDWSAVKHYLNTHLPKPRTVDRWLKVAEQVRDRAV